MKNNLLASIVVNNYNYARFLSDAIDSALNQTYRSREIIVVDDGSSDNSREIIAGYGNRVLPLLKENGGQASALNAGFAASRGNVVFFLDSDDILLPTALENVMPLFEDPAVTKVHWPVYVVNKDGDRTGEIHPGRGVPRGDLREQVRRDGSDIYAWPTACGNAWARSFLNQLLPIPEAVYRRGADTYPVMLAPFFGPIDALQEPQSLYRIHGGNNWRRMTFDAKVAREIDFFEDYHRVAVRHCEQMGFKVDPEAWRQRSWWHRIRLAMREIETVVPPDAPFVFVDNDTWGMDETATRRPIPLLERDGRYWGPPPDDATAIGELRRLREAGAQFIVFAWPAFWWLEHYDDFRRHVWAEFHCALRTDRIIAFDMRR